MLVNSYYKPIIAAGHRRWLLAVLFLVAVAVPCAVFYYAAAPDAVIFRWLEAKETEDAKLERVLGAASMEDKTVIVIPLNSAWAVPGSIMDVVLESFHIGNGTQNLVKHLVMVCLDHQAYSRCMAIHKHCFALFDEGQDLTGERSFMSAEYLDMVWKKIDFLRVVLQKGYNFIFADADIVWFRNPIPQFYSDSDFQVSCDNYNGNASDIMNMPNSGFKYVKSNNHTIAFYKYWYSARHKYTKQHDQNVLNILMKFDPNAKEFGVRFKFLSTEYFGGMCKPSEDFSKVCTMHSNCCFTEKAKVKYLKMMLNDWRNYTSLPQGIEKLNYTWSFRQRRPRF